MRMAFQVPEDLVEVVGDVKQFVPICWPCALATLTASWDSEEAEP